MTSIAVLACGLTLFFACGESSQSKRAGSDAPSVAVEATPVSSLSSLSTSIAATLPDATTSISSVPATSAPDVTVLLDSGDLVPQLVGQTYVFNVDDLNSGSLSRLGSVVMPDGTQLTSESSVGVGAALMVISIPDRGSIVLLTVPGAELPSAPDAAYQVVDGVEIMLGDGERILTSDCMLDGRFPDGRVVAVIPGGPEFGENIPVRLAWLANQDTTSLDHLDPTRLTCSLSNPD